MKSLVLKLINTRSKRDKIYGNPNSINWMQYIGSKKNSFYNPVRQNANHCKNLSRALGISADRIFSFVVFENRADLSNVFPIRGENFTICNRCCLLGELINSISAKEPVFSREELRRIIEKLRAWSNVEAGAKQRHIQQIQNKMYGDVCPLCGKKLVERTGRYGVFVGCTGYPKCRYTRDKAQ